MKRLHAYALRDSTSFAIPKGQAINCGIKRTAKLFCRRSSFHRHGPLASKPEAGSRQQDLPVISHNSMLHSINAQAASYAWHSLPSVMLISTTHAKRVLFGLALAGAAATAFAQSDPLPSWNEGPAKAAIASFVAKVTSPGSKDFVAPDERVAVFDNDGTLMVEQPSSANINLAFSFDRIRALAPANPAWQSTQPFKAVLDDDKDQLTHLSQGDVAKLYLAAYTGMDESSFAQIAGAWMSTARNAHFKRRYVDLVYQPQLELLTFLRAQGFKTFLVSGGDVDFLREFALKNYGITPDQVIGSTVQYAYTAENGKPTIQRLGMFGVINNGSQKAISIQLHIGLTPILAFGNADGDEPMLAMTAANKKPHLVLILHHDDGAREVAYDREESASFGRLNALLDEAASRHWQVVSMRRDFKTLFPSTPAFK